jgi:hypothetical protein
MSLNAVDLVADDSRVNALPAVFGVRRIIVAITLVTLCLMEIFAEVKLQVGSGRELCVVV